ncbi:protein translocase subunit SecDF [Fulvivirgaceae bacterium BMA12]|uniref:Multifunctional fusion protein n=1 Tax=Agaribacillus aureus TaxID=3051825 RepID=A0ABT8LER1_9BACT|nr:protein translocase subunit SecDF [Fulvivirgaceae bacterium BMA12]
MRNKGAVIILTVLVTLLCLYYLSFTFKASSVQKDAIAFATDESGVLNFSKKRQYLDSIWHEPVYNLFGIQYTYEDVKKNELALGLDLQGGMHVTLEVTPDEIIKSLAGNTKDETFLQALEDAKKLQRNSQAAFSDLFYQAYGELGGQDRRLVEIFSNAANRDRISLQSSAGDVLELIREEVDGAIDRSFNILRTRVDQFGTSQPNIQRIQGTNRIQIELPGVEDVDRVRKLLQGVAKLEFWEVADFQEYAASINAVSDLLLQEKLAKTDTLNLTDSTAVTSTEDALNALVEDASPEDTTEVDDENLAAQLEGSDSTSGALDSLANRQVSPLQDLLSIQFDQSGKAYLYCNVKDTAKLNRIFEREDVKSLMPPNVVFRWQVKPDSRPDEQVSDLLELNPLRVGRGGQAPLTGEVITNAYQGRDEVNRPAVHMVMNATGAKKWKRLTGANVNRRIAIVLDNKVISAPNVSSEIPNGQSVISGNFTIEETGDMANLLKAGKLPAPTRIVSEAIIGPTLGQQAQSQGITSIIIGLAIVVIFMIFYYAKGGLVANAALVFNIFFIFGILAQFKTALTLPGIAGIVLTIGMSIDANVLIFERIREEIKNGVSLLKAISNGYQKAFWSIFDANFTTLLTAVILALIGEGPVKGFAVTLIIGIFCSFFTAVFVTRLIMMWLSKKGDQSKISFATPFSKGLLSNVNWDFLGKRKKAYLASAAFIVIGMTALILKGGLNLGVDFKGGRSYVVSFSQPQVASKVETALLDDFENAGTEVKFFGTSNKLKITTSYLVDDEATDADNKVRDVMIKGLEAYSGQQFISDDTKVDDTHFTILSSEKVGATIADDIKSSSQKAIFFSLIVIFLYILIRFRKWQFGLGAIVALFHDTLVVISAFAIARLLGIAYEVDQVFIAAMLTIIGYSINDTVVVFDRIRETLGLRGTTHLEKTFNLSINNTVSRTLITSATTLFVVLVLFLFGGAVLKGFSFALLVGILAGTYSSIYVATPVVIDLTKKSLAKESVKQKA